MYNAALRGRNTIIYRLRQRQRPCSNKSAATLTYLHVTNAASNATSPLDTKTHVSPNMSPVAGVGSNLITSKHG